MAGWSTEVADALVALAAARGKLFDQTSVQRLLYIAHGVRLATSGHALTGDRPEAWETGPIYRRLAEALARFGTRPVTSVIESEGSPEATTERESINYGLDSDERELLERVLDSYGHFSAAQLGILTCGKRSPWNRVYAGGAGKNRDISHAMVREHFERHSNLRPN